MKIYEFEEELNKRLADKEFSGYGWQSDVEREVEKILAEVLGLSDDQRRPLYYKQYGRGQSISITYDHTVQLIWIDVKKKRGDRHHIRWGGDYYDWTYGQCEVGVCGDKVDTIEEAWAQMMDKYYATKDEAKIKLLKAADIVSQIQGELKLDDYAMRSYLEYLNKNWYSIKDVISKRKKETV